MMRLSIGYPEKESEITLTRNSLENKSIFAVFTLTPVISFAYILLVLSRFKIYQYFECPEIVSRHVIPFYFTLQNEDFFAFSGVRVNLSGSTSSIRIHQ